MIETTNEPLNFINYFKTRYYELANNVSSFEDLTNLLADLRGNSNKLDVETYKECVAHTSVALIKYLFSKEAYLLGEELKASGAEHYIFWYLSRALFDREGPMQIVEFDDMLYPFFEGNFDRKITQNTHKYLMDRAKGFLEARIPATDAVVEHWKFIAEGGIPFGYTLKD